MRPHPWSDSDWLYCKKVFSQCTWDTSSIGHGSYKMRGHQPHNQKIIFSTYIYAWPQLCKVFYSQFSPKLMNKIVWPQSEFVGKSCPKLIHKIGPKKHVFLFQSRSEMQRSWQDVETFRKSRQKRIDKKFWGMSMWKKDQYDQGSMLLSQFSAIFANFQRKIGVFIKIQCSEQFFSRTSSSLGKKPPLFSPNFSAKIF
jgi:hypothetical protein